jgi:hypothetical protein
MTWKQHVLVKGRIALGLIFVFLLHVAIGRFGPNYIGVNSAEAIEFQQWFILQGCLLVIFYVAYEWFGIERPDVYAYTSAFMFFASELAISSVLARRLYLLGNAMTGLRDGGSVLVVFVGGLTIGFAYWFIAGYRSVYR